MRTKFKNAKEILAKEGLLSLIKRAINYYVLSFLYLPFCYIKIQMVKKSNADIYKLINFTFNECDGYLRPVQVKSELSSLLKYIKDFKPQTVMEIGTADGGTLFLFSRVIPEDAFIISLDLPGGKFGGGYPFWKIPLYKSFSSNKQKIHLVREDSHKEKTLRKIENILSGRKINFLFIDGDHSYEGVKRDFDLYSQLVKKGGIIVFHDIAPHPPETECGVSRFWNEIKKKYVYEEFLEDRKQNWAGIGLIKS